MEPQQQTEERPRFVVPDEAKTVKGFIRLLLDLEAAAATARKPHQDERKIA